MVVNPLSAIHLASLLAPPLLYGLSLVAVLLLAFPGKRVDQAISFILSVLWAWMAFDFWFELFAPADRGSFTWLGALLPAQAALFLWSGTVRARLRFEPRGGAGPVVGGLFLLWSLVLQPLLATALHIERLQGPFLGLPFPGVLFTFGLLLFLERDFQRKAVAPALAWAAIGGVTAFRTGEPHDWGLLLALLAGSFLVLPNRLTIEDPEGNLRQETWYEHAARHHQRCGRSVLALLLLTCLLGFLVTASRGPLFLLVRQLELGTTVMAVLLLGLWLALPAWYSSGFRLLAWEATQWLRVGRKAWDWLTARWGGVIVLVTLTLWAVLEVYKSIRPSKDVFSSTNLWIAALAVILVYAVYQARRRIVIAEFMDYTEDQELKGCGKGLASRLRNELASVTTLYRTIDEALPPLNGTSVGVTVRVEDVLKSLEDVVGPDSSTMVGPFQIPVGLLLRGIGWLARGPRLTGSLHREGESLLLVADLSGGGLSGSWRVSSADLAEEERQPRTAAVYRLSEQLAYRVVTSLGNLGSPRWEAVRHFTNGLRDYRTTQVVKGDVSPELRAAERKLIQALSTDRNFWQCHYNLGVVYQALQCWESAEASYRKNLEENSDWSEGYYALATVYYDSGKLEKAAIFARRTIEIVPGDARAWNLSGIARFARRDEEARTKGLLEQTFRGPAWDDIVQSFQIATAVAWRSLCVAALKDSSRSLGKEKQLAVGCSNNLGIVRGDGGDGEGRRSILSQSIRLSPRNARAHLVYGESYFEEKHWLEARAKLYQVFGDALNASDQVARWIYLLGTHLALLNVQSPAKDEENIWHAYTVILDNAVPPESMILGSRWDAAAEEERKAEYRKQLRYFMTALQAISAKLPKPSEPFGSLMRLVLFLQWLELESGNPGQAAPQLEAYEKDWAQAQTDIRDARQLLEREPLEARQKLDRAIKLLDRMHSRQAERQGLRSLLARAYLLESERGGAPTLLIEAIEHAQASVDQEPGSSTRRWILGSVYSALGDFNEASTERETAMNLGSRCEILDDPSALSRIARDYLRLAGLPESPAPEARLRRGLIFFQRILQSVESRKSNRSETQFASHAAAHFWIGRFHCELGEGEEAVHHLQIARSMAFRPLEIGLRLGNLYSWNQDHGRARRVFVESLAAARRKSKAPDGTPLADETPAEVEVELLLSCAMLYAERNVRLKLSAYLCQRAKKRFPKVPLARRRELRVLYHECRGWIYFRERDIKKSQKQLERAALVGGNRAYVRLARVYEKAGEFGLTYRGEALRKASEAREKALASNGRLYNGLSRGVFDLGLLPLAPPKSPATPPAGS